MKIFTIGVVALVLLLVGCGGTTDTATPISTSTPTVASTPGQTRAVVATPAPTAQPGDGQATLEIRVTDAPPEGVSKIQITVRSVEVNKSEGPTPAGWETVVSEPQTFDLVQLTGVEAVLGSRQLEPGQYNQIRLDVVEAIITIDGEEKVAKVPSGKLRLAGSFELTAGETTLVTLDFDAGKSVVLRGKMDPILKPVVKLLVRRSGDPFSAAAPVSEGSAPSEGTPEPLSANAVRVFIPTADNLQFMSFWVAMGAGFFNDEGLDIRVELPPMAGGGAQFLFQGRADVGVFPPPQYLNLIGQGQPLLIFANLLQHEPVNLVVSRDIADELQISSDAPLKERLEATQGLRVGVAPGPVTTLRTLYASVGLDIDSDIETIVMDPEKENEAFGEGEVDALYAHTPFLEKALVEQGAVMIVNLSAGEVPELIFQQIHTMATTQSYAAANPEVLVALSRGLHRAQQLIHSDQQATADALMAAVEGLDPQRLQTIIGIYEPAIPQSPEVSVEGVLQILGRFPEHRTPPDLSGIDLNTHVDPQFALRAVSGGDGSGGGGGRDPGRGGGDGSGGGAGKGGGGGDGSGGGTGKGGGG